MSNKKSGRIATSRDAVVSPYKESSTLPRKSSKVEGSTSAAGATCSSEDRQNKGSDTSKVRKSLQVKAKTSDQVAADPYIARTSLILGRYLIAP